MEEEDDDDEEEVDDEGAAEVEATTIFLYNTLEWD